MATQSISLHPVPFWVITCPQWGTEGVFGKYGEVGQETHGNASARAEEKVFSVSDIG